MPRDRDTLQQESPAAPRCLCPRHFAALLVPRQCGKRAGAEGAQQRQGSMFGTGLGPGRRVPHPPLPPQAGPRRPLGSPFRRGRGRRAACISLQATGHPLALCYPVRAACTAPDEEEPALGTVWARGNQTAQVLLKLGSRRDQGEEPKPPGPASADVSPAQERELHCHRDPCHPTGTRVLLGCKGGAR